MAETGDAGRRAEDAAAAFLESNGWRVLTRNFRTRFGEIDIVADAAGVLVLVEVKYRRDEAFAPAEESLTAAKRAKLFRAGRAAAAVFGPGKNVRFDLLAIVGPPDSAEIRHYQSVIEGRDL